MNQNIYAEHARVPAERSPLLPHRIDRLDHLRAFAAILVVVWHGTGTNVEKPHLLLALFQEGHTGVSLFCVVSGFILSYLYINSNISYGDFIKRRALRILPLLILYIFLAYSTSPETMGELATQVFLGVKFGAPLKYITTQDWTVFVELQFYLIFPFLLTFVRRYGKRYIIGLLVLSILFRLQNYLTQGGAQAMGYWTIFGRVDQFLWGMFAGVALKHGSFDRITRSWATYPIFVISAAAVMIWIYYYRQTGGFLGATPIFTSRESVWIVLPSIEGFLWSSVIVSYIMLPLGFRSWTAKTFSACFAFIGRVSYSIYLNQFAVMACFGEISPISISSGTTWEIRVLITLFIMLPVLIIVSTFTYYVVELPFIRLKTRAPLVVQPTALMVG